MSVTVSKELVLAKMQEFDASLQSVIAATQAAVRMRSELWSMIADLPEYVELAEVQVPLTFYENGHVIGNVGQWGQRIPFNFMLFQFSEFHFQFLQYKTTNRAAIVRWRFAPLCPL